MTTFVLVDETNGAPTTSGEALTPEKLAAIASACTVQLNRDAGPEHGSGPDLVRVGTKDAIQPGEVVFVFLPATPSAPGAIAYHDVDGNGVAVAYDAITASDTVLGTGNSASIAASHEMLEIKGDEGCNLWADRGDGTEVAHELCDAVESSSYPITLSDGTTVYVSNFVLRSFFDANHAGPYDFMTRQQMAGATPPPGPMQTAPAGGGNYQIVRSTNASSEHQVTAKEAMGAPTVSVTVSMPFGAKLRRPWRHGSRRARRGVVQP